CCGSPVPCLRRGADSAWRGKLTHRSGIRCAYRVECARPECAVALGQRLGQIPLETGQGGLELPTSGFGDCHLAPTFDIAERSFRSGTACGHTRRHTAAPTVQLPVVPSRSSCVCAE